MRFISVLLISFWMILILFLTPAQVNAQATASAEADSLLQLELNRVIVSAQRAPLRFSELRRSVQVVSRQEIEQSGAQDMSALLSLVRGVDVRSRGSFGMQSDIIIRGGTFDQTLVLLNGVNLTDPQTGHHNLNLPVDISSIERIEVLHGAGARIFGPNAFNGAINIITREPGTEHLQVSGSAGQHGFANAGLSAGFETGMARHHFSMGGIRSSGYIENTDFRNGSLFYHIKHPAAGGEASLQAGFNGRAFGANSFYTPVFPDQFEQTQTFFAALSWQPDGALRLTPTVYWRRHSDRFELFRNEAPAWYSGHNYHQSDILGATLNWTHLSRFGSSSAGLAYRYEHIWSNVLGDPLSEPRAVPGASEAFFTKAFGRTGLSLMAEHSFTYGPFSLSGGGLLYYNSDLAQDVTFFPGIDAGVQLSERLRIYGSLNRTLRLPTFTDLFYEGPNNLGNPDLQPERAISAETGFMAGSGPVFWESAFFRRWGTNIIDWTRRPGEDSWRSENLTEVTISGMEHSLTWYLPAALTPLSGTGTGVHRSLKLSYAFIDAGRRSGAFISNYALDFLQHKVAMTLRHPLTSNGGFVLNISWQQRAGEFMLFENGAFTESKPFEPFFMTDLHVFARFGNFTLFAEASNALDVSYNDIANVPQPGRWIRSGLSFTLR